MCNLWSYVNSQSGENTNFAVLNEANSYRKKAFVVQGTLAVGNAQRVAGIQNGQ